MENPKLIEIIVDDVIYGYMFWDFRSYVRLDVYQNNRRIGQRELPVHVDQGETTVIYLIRRMVGNYGPFRKTIATREISSPGVGRRDWRTGMR